MAVKKTKNRDRQLQKDEAQEVAKAIANGLKLLGLPPKKAPSHRVQEAIRDQIAKVVLAKKRTAKSIRDEMALNLGCLWGQTVCDAAGWEWCVATVDGEEFIAVVPKNRAYVLAALDFVFTQLGKRSPQENTSLLLFNMIMDGKSFGKGKAGAYVTLG